MDEKFTITEMKLEHGLWTVRFKSVTNAAGFGTPVVKIEPEEFQGPAVGMHTFTPEEVIERAHRALTLSLLKLLKTSIASSPKINLPYPNQSDLPKYLIELGIDDGA